MIRAQAPAAWQTPIQWPELAGPPQALEAPRTAGLMKALIVVAMFALTVLDRFGFRLIADTAIPVGMMAMYLLVGAMVLMGAAQLNGRGALAFLAITAVAALSHVVNLSFGPPPYVSASSLLLLLMLYAPFCVTLRPGAVAPELWRWTVDAYVVFALIVAAAGIVQYFVQFAFKPPWLFDYTYLLPERLRATQHWATVHDTGTWAKSNGFFMREPSLFSIVMALGLLCELSVRRRMWALAAFGLGLLLSYSGSGLLCVGIALLFPLGRGTMARVAALGILGSAIFLFFGEALRLTYTLERVTEIFSTGSSAYCRFVYPTLQTFYHMDSATWTALLGHGPGSIIRMGGTCPSGFDPAFAKAIFEYGFLGLVLFTLLIFDSIQRSRAPGRIRAGAAVTWITLTGLLAGETLLFIYLVSAMWPPGTARKALA